MPQPCLINNIIYSHTNVITPVTAVINENIRVICKKKVMCNLHIHILIVIAT